MALHNASFSHFPVCSRTVNLPYIYICLDAPNTSDIFFDTGIISPVQPLLTATCWLAVEDDAHNVTYGEGNADKLIVPSLTSRFAGVTNLT